MSTTGYDVSVYQQHTPPLAGKGFLFARASYGTARDPLYGMHIANARAAGVVTGAYHFGVHGQTAAAQAHTFLTVAGAVDLYVLDLEKDGNNPRMTDDQARTFMSIVGLRHKVGLYHSESGFPTLGQDYNWIAKWGPNPPARAWKFWQYRGSPLDLDVFNGDIGDLRRFVGQAVPPTPAPKIWWGSDVTDDVKALDPTGVRVLKAIKATRTGIGSVINFIDLEVAMNKRGIDYHKAGYVAATKELLK